MAEKKYHILCVEDHDDTCEMHKVLLADYKVTTVGTCAEAIQKALTEQINLYLLDNWLPDGTGTELCKQIRKLHPTTPVIFYSAATSDSDRKDAIEAGANGYLVKPVDISNLLFTIAGLIKSEITQRLKNVLRTAVGVESTDEVNRA
jgi:DNA-binding response OmpR family regulator